MVEGWILWTIFLFSFLDFFDYLIRPFFNAPVASQESPDEDFVVRFNIFIKIRSKSSFIIFRLAKSILA